MDEKIGIQVSNDGGLDGFGYITSQDDFRTNRVAIQAKRWNGNIQSPEIDKFRGAMDKHNAEYGIFITTSSFSRGAIQASRQGTRVITLIDGDKIRPELEGAFNKAIKKVGEDIENIKFNTAIATLMALINDISNVKSINKEELRIFSILLNPFAPHVTE